MVNAGSLLETTVLEVRQLVMLLEIPPMEVSGYFRSSLLRLGRITLNPTDGSRLILQVQPRKRKTLVKSIVSSPGIASPVVGH